MAAEKIQIVFQKKHFLNGDTQSFSHPDNARHLPFWDKGLKPQIFLMQKFLVSVFGISKPELFPPYPGISLGPF